MKWVHFSLDKDNKRWKIVNQTDFSGQRIVQYVPEGETSNNWTELFTIQLVEGRLVPPNIYDLLLKIWPKWALVTTCATELSAWIQRGSLPNGGWTPLSPISEHEWVRIFNADEFTIIIRYTTKKTDKLEDAQKIVGTHHHRCLVQMGS